MTDRRARLVALAMFSTATFCFALAYRMFFGPGATSLSRVVGGLVLVIDGAAVIMNVFTYRMHQPGSGDGDPTSPGIDGGSGALDTPTQKAGGRRRDGDSNTKGVPRHETAIGPPEPAPPPTISHQESIRERLR
jgi:hypothetical protein